MTNKKNSVKVTLILFAILQLLLTEIALACSCMKSAENPQILLSKYDAVFLGKVIQIKKSPKEVYEVKMRILKSYKGGSAEFIVVFTASYSASCGYNFIEDEDYLVYANSYPDGLWVDNCSPTKRFSKSQEDLKTLEVIKAQFK